MAQVVPQWVLRSVIGEHEGAGELPTSPDPSWPPEAVVMAQLEALQSVTLHLSLPPAQCPRCLLMHTNAFDCSVCHLVLHLVRDMPSHCRQRDVARVFAFASPSNQAMTGPLPNFAAMLSSPMYEPLLGHTLAEMHLVAQRGSDKATVVVRKSCLCRMFCHKLLFAGQSCSFNHCPLQTSCPPFNFSNLATLASCCTCGSSHCRKARPFVQTAG